MRILFFLILVLVLGNCINADESEALCIDVCSMKNFETAVNTENATSVSVKLTKFSELIKKRIGNPEIELSVLVIGCLQSGNPRHRYYWKPEVQNDECEWEITKKDLHEYELLKVFVRAFEGNKWKTYRKYKIHLLSKERTITDSLIILDAALKNSGPKEILEIIENKPISFNFQFQNLCREIDITISGVSNKGNEKVNLVNIRSKNVEEKTVTKTILHNNTYTKYVVTLSYKEVNSDKSQERLWTIPIKAIKEESYIPAFRCDLLTGYEFSQASSADQFSRLFIDLNLSQKLTNWLNVWGFVRLTSMPQTSLTPIVSGDNQGQVIQFSSLVDKMKSAVEMLGGVELRLIDFSPKKTYEKTTLNVLFAAGFITPLPVSETAHVFKLNPNIKKNFVTHPNSKETINYEEKEYISFANPSRNEFFRQYHIGFRIKSVEESFERRMDILWGLNDVATSGEGNLWGRSVWRLDGFLPFKINNVTIFLFGTAVLNTQKETLENAVFYELAPNNIGINHEKVVQITMPYPVRDYYKIGIGMDLCSLFKKTE